jgi:glycosyltransferase involved in cell wall biosynthesis
VLVISHVSALWGAQLRLLDSAPRLGPLGIDLTLAGPAGPFAERWQELGLTWMKLPLPQHAGIRTTEGGRPGPIAITREGAAVARSVGRIARVAAPFDVLHSHSLWAHLEVALAGRIRRRPVVLDVHDIVAPGGGRKVLQLAASLATATIANSAATGDTIGRSARMHVVHPGVDTARFHPGPTDPAIRRRLTAYPQRPLVAILGRVDPDKRIDLLCRAVAKLGDGVGAPCLAVVGAPYKASLDQQTHLRAECAELLGDRIRFVEPTTDVASVLRSIDVLVNASDDEPFGRTILESQACGTAVVAAAGGGVPEFVDDGETGLLFPPGDVAALADALRRLLDDQAFRRRIGERAARCATELSADRQAERTAAVYRQAIEA